MAINTLNFMASKKLCISVLSLAFFLLPSFVFSQKIGYQIKLKVDNFEETEAYLGYFFGDKQYIKDTAYVEQDGQFYFEGNEKLDPGIYIVVLPPDNQYFQILVGEDEQWFSVETKAPGFDANMKIKGSKDNQLFYSYLNYLNEKRPEAKALREKLEAEKDENGPQKS